MAKSVGSACAQIAVLLAVCSWLHGAAARLEATSYDTLDTALPYLNPEPHVVYLSTDQVHRQTRAAPADVSPPVSTSQYQSVNSEASAAVAAGAGADVDVSGVDISDDDIESKVKNESLVRREDFHEYYRSVLYVSAEEAKVLWSQLKNTPQNIMLSSSHRRAMFFELNFDFPFYGKNVRKITVATGGFLYTGEYVHSWLASTQYIAPLMANFDTNMSIDSFVRVQDNGTAFTAVWENVMLQDKPEFGKFTFSVTLHQSGDIVFGYFRVPTAINSIQDLQHPVKVGLSDAYIIEKQLYFARRNTIYEYHRVSFQQQEITNSTIIKLTAQPTCLGYNDCQSCLSNNTTFTCFWCPALSSCSTGTDRNKNEWMTKGCEAAALPYASICQALREKGNNAAQEENFAAGGKTSGAANATNPSTAATGSPVGTESTVISKRAPAATAGQSKPVDAAAAGGHTDGNVGNAEAGADNKSVGVAFGFLLPICLVFAVTLWLFYAYRNPDTKSGKLIIQFRPSQRPC